MELFFVVASVFVCLVLTLLRVLASAKRDQCELSRALDRLERWRDAYDQMRPLLAEFPDIADSLDLMREIGEGRRTNFGSVIQLRIALRERRDKTAIRLSPAEIQSGHDRVRWAELLIRQLPADHDGRNSWLLNYAREGIEYADARPVTGDAAYRSNHGGFAGGA